MAASALFQPFTATTATGDIDFLLREVTRALQLGPEQRALAEQEYDSLSRWLNRTMGGLQVFDPVVYPQGSMSYGTTVRPRVRDEFDLDCVVELPFFHGPALSLLRSLHSDLSLCKDYKGRLEVLNRCIRIKVERLFYIDVLPARHDAARGGTCIEIPDRQLRDWSYSNPKGFRDWFERCCAFAYELMLKARAYEPLPEEEAVELKAVLKQVVQLLKRHRDMVFEEDDDAAPRSIVLTTLAGYGYHGQPSIIGALSSVLDSIHARIESANGAPFELCNPMNPDECFSEAWGEDPERYEAFVDWVGGFRARIAKLPDLALPQLAKELGSLFGETVAERAVSIFAKSMHASSNRGALRMSPAAQLTVVSSVGKPVPKHQFYGRS